MFSAFAQWVHCTLETNNLMPWHFSLMHYKFKLTVTKVFPRACGIQMLLYKIYGVCAG